MFIIFVPLGIILLLAVLSIPFVKRYHHKHFKKYCYKKIYSDVLDNDYYLINEFTFKIDDSHYTIIDHIVFGEKFIYVIMDEYLEGDLLGKDNDPSFILMKNGNKTYVDNYLMVLNKLLRRFSSCTGISTDLMIGVMVINDNVNTTIDSNSKQFFIIQRSKFKKLIKLIESRDVKVIDPSKLDEAVKIIDQLNKKKSGKITT